MKKSYSKILDCFGKEIQAGKNQNIPIVVHYYDTIVIGKLINVVEYKDKVIVNFEAGNDKSCQATHWVYDGVVTFREFALLTSVTQDAVNTWVQKEMLNF